MAKNDQYFTHWKGSPDIAPFLGYLRELGLLKFSGIRKHSMDLHYNDGIEICYILKGTHKWQLEGTSYQLLPGEGFITCPWQRHGNPDGMHERGVLCWLILHPQCFHQNGDLQLGDWSRLDRETQQAIGNLLAGNKSPVIPKGCNLLDIYRTLNTELTHKKIGYKERINMLLDSLLVHVARSLMERESEQRTDGSFSRRLQEKMDECISQKTDMNDLAYFFGMSLSTFSKRVKELTGFTPADYLLKLKISLAKKILSQTSRSITQIAAECGFSSSQHFSSQFTKRVGISPSLYRTGNKETRSSS